MSELEGLRERWLLYVDSDPMVKAGVDILNMITSKGYGAWIVGGSVRDLVLGQPVKDVDIATNMPIPELDKIFNTHDIGQSKDFGIVTITHRDFQFEIAQLRAETYEMPKIVRKILT